MKRKRYSVEQITAILQQAEAGIPIAELVRKAGIAEQCILSVEKTVRWTATE